MWRVRRRARQDEPTVLVQVDPGEQLGQMNVEILGDRARHVTLEQEDKSETRDEERGQDRDDAAGRESEPQRSPVHAARSGTV